MRNKVSDTRSKCAIYSLSLSIDALEQQKVHYERQLAELRDRLQEVEVGEPVTTSPPAGSLRARSRPIFSPM